MAVHGSVEPARVVLARSFARLDSRSRPSVLHHHREGREKERKGKRKKNVLSSPSSRRHKDIVENKILFKYNEIERQFFSLLLRRERLRKDSRISYSRERDFSQKKNLLRLFLSRLCTLLLIRQSIRPYVGHDDIKTCRTYRGL